jgi:membrane protein DedA with SNARE-associated domain
MIDHQAIAASTNTLISQFGDLGVFVAMFLESSILPIPSEAVVIAAGAIGVPLISIVIFGSLGATLGSAVGYSIGKFAAMPVILRFGKYIFIKPHHIKKAEEFAKKYGAPSVLIGRLLPIVPFKVFSIAAGITGIRFLPFMVFTMIGVVPRMYILAVFGSVLTKYTKPTLLILAAILLIYVSLLIWRKIYVKADKENKPDSLV